MRNFNQTEIKALNDAFRSRVGMPVLNSPLRGMIVFTAGINALAPAVQAEIAAKVRNFSDFTSDNDPYNEHDFGGFRHSGKKVFWKIDYYDDETMASGSEDPSDPQRSFRVLTIMLASEY